MVSRYVRAHTVPIFEEPNFIAGWMAGWLDSENRKRNEPIKAFIVKAIELILADKQPKMSWIFIWSIELCMSHVNVTPKQAINCAFYTHLMSNFSYFVTSYLGVSILRFFLPLFMVSLYGHSHSLCVCDFPFHLGLAIRCICLIYA